MGVKGRFEFSQKIIHFGTMTRPLNAEPIVKYENEGYDVIIPDICHFFYTGKIFGE